MAVARISVGINSGNFVPYTGATGNVNLGSNNLTLNRIIGTTNTSGAWVNDFTNSNASGFSDVGIVNDQNDFASVAVFGSTGGQGTLYINNSAWVALSSIKAGVVNERIGGELIFANGGTGSASEVFKINSSNGIQIYEAKNIVLGTATGTKIGTATNQKLGFYNATPVIQQTGGAATAGAVYTAAEQTMLQTVYNMARTMGLLS